jgi:hypothetical protein
MSILIEGGFASMLAGATARATVLLLMAWVAVRALRGSS